MGLTAIKDIIRKRAEVLLHLMLLAFYFSALNVSWQEDWLDWQAHEEGVRPISALAAPAVFYLNAFWLIPRFLKQKRWWAYGVLALAVAAFMESGRALVYLLYEKGMPTALFREFIGEFLSFRHIGDAILSGYAFSFAYAFTKDWVINLSLIERLKAEKASAELAFLKSQVNPHFLFNTLNSLYALALEEKGERTADAIAQLGTLMRYNLHDSQARFIPLVREIDYIEKYIALQALRATEKNQIVVQRQIDEGMLREKKIAPMLLIPFIENAFKYGISPTEPGSIHICISVKEDTFLLDVRNSIISNARAMENEGLGLQNARQRLELLYPDGYRLQHGKTGDEYKVQLALKLDP